MTDVLERITKWMRGYADRDITVDLIEACRCEITTLREWKLKHALQAVQCREDDERLLDFFAGCVLKTVPFESYFTGQENPLPGIAAMAYDAAEAMATEKKRRREARHDG